MAPTLYSLKNIQPEALTLDPLDLDLFVGPRTMAQWSQPQYQDSCFGQIEDEINGMHMSSSAGYTSGTYSRAPVTTHAAFSWHAPTSNHSSYSSSYDNSAPTLSSASMQYSLSTSSSHSGQHYTDSRKSSAASAQSDQETSQMYIALLSQYQVGTPEYDKVLAQYQEWHAGYRARLANGFHGESVEDEDEDEDDDETLTARTETIIDPKSGKQKRVFRCPHQPCLAQPGRKADLDRHINSVHAGEGKKLHNCTQPGCARQGHRGFTRPDHLREHLRNYHHLAEVYPKKGGRKGDKSGQERRRK